MIALEGVTAGYGGKVVLALPRLAVAAGEHTLVLGPSGSGKSTLLAVIAGLLPAATGSVTVNGQRLDGLSPAARDAFRGRHVGMVMQRLHLIGALDVEANLALAMKLGGKPPDRALIEALLEALGIAHKRHSRPRELSQGEAQRVAIARAVVNRPVLLLADEPTSALDDAACEAAIGLLFAQASRHGATLVAATHDARLAPHFRHVVRLAA